MAIENVSNESIHEATVNYYDLSNCYTMLDRSRSIIIDLQLCHWPVIRDMTLTGQRHLKMLREDYGMSATGSRMTSSSRHFENRCIGRNDNQEAPSQVTPCDFRLGVGSDLKRLGFSISSDLSTSTNSSLNTMTKSFLDQH